MEYTDLKTNAIQKTGHRHKSVKSLPEENCQWAMRAEAMRTEFSPQTTGNKRLLERGGRGEVSVVELARAKGYKAKSKISG